MAELPPPDSERIKEERKIKSPSQMARALGFFQDAKTAHSSDRNYSKDFLEKGPYPAVKVLYSGDHSDGQLEEVSLGVRLKEPWQDWTEENSVFSDAFLNWFTEKGGDFQLADDVRQLKTSTPRGQKNRVKKAIMREKGYPLVAQIIEQAEELGYFEYLWEKLSSEFEEKKAIAEETVRIFLEQFPQYPFFSNRFGEEKAFYATKPEIKKGRIAAMRININPHLDPENTGTIEFQLGSMKIDKDEILSDFRPKNLPKLSSTGQYPQRWFKGKMLTILEGAIKARKKIQTELKQ